VDQREAIDEDGDVVPCFIGTCSLFILVNHLKAIVMDVFFVDEVNVLGSAVVTPEKLFIVGLNFSGLFDDAFAAIGKSLGKEALPFSV